MYASEVDGRKLTFFVSGKLWGRSLVMRDKETRSDWSHILGQAMAGKMKGKSLTILPATMTTWQDWLEQHPHTTVAMLRPTANTFNVDMLESTEDFCMGLVHNGEARHWRFDLLAKPGVVNDRLGDLDLVVYYDKTNSSAHVWNSRSQQQALTFEHQPQGIVDTQTESTWDLRKGLATAGELKGTRLKATTAIVSFSGAWQRFHPDTTGWEPSSK